MHFEKRFNANYIKFIAIIAMTIDHLAWILFPGFSTEPYVLIAHIIGRLTAPIMWFCVAEGCFYTHDIKKYALRLFFFAFISHFTYNFAFGIPFIPFKEGIVNQTGVIWGLAWAVVLIAIFKNDEIKNWVKVLCAVLICLVAFPADWSMIAVLCPLFLYYSRGNIRLQGFYIFLFSFIYALVYFFFISKLYGALQLCTCLSIPIIASYNGERGNVKGLKWLFYLYYPAHLFAVGMVRLLIHGNAALGYTR